MPVKRSRDGSSSATVVAAAASVSHVKGRKSDPSAEPSRSKLTIASPVNVDKYDHMKIGGFLERCHYCKKRIAQDSEVFMYRTTKKKPFYGPCTCTYIWMCDSCSDLCAFCSVECRDIQINLDQSAEKNRENPK